MKNRIFCVFVIFATLPAVAQHEKKADSKITHVTVFLNKAQVTREVKTRIAEGVTQLTIPGLSPQLDPASIQVSGNGNFVLLGVTHQMNYLNELSTPARLVTLNDSVRYLQRQVQFETTQKQILEKEEQMIIANQKIGGADQNLPVNELKSMADFFRARLSEIAIAKLNLDEKIRMLNERLAKVQQQIGVINELHTRSTSEIVVNLSASASTDANLTIKYLASNARWTPVYEVRGVNVTSPLKLFYRANVFQATGEDWKNVKLTLSTGNPSVGSVKPELHPWHLDFYQQPRTYYDKSRGRVAADAPAQAMSEAVLQESSTVADYVQVSQEAITTSFDISIPYTVNSTNKATAVDIGRYDLKSHFRYSAAPKLDPDAFLMAGTAGWAELNLLPGEANVFFEGTFVGKTVIDPRSVRDTLFFSLGRDHRIVVKRQRIKDYNARAIIGLNQKESHGYEINIRNNKAEAITITVEDHIPVSMNNQIEVSLLDGGGAKFTPVDGKLVWEITLKPNETRRLAYLFEVKYPKDKVIAGL